MSKKSKEIEYINELFDFLENQERKRNRKANELYIDIAHRKFRMWDIFKINENCYEYRRYQPLKDEYIFLNNNKFKVITNRAYSYRKVVNNI